MTDQATSVIGWTQLQHDTMLLAQQLGTAGRFNGILAVPRGGLVPAAIIACALDLRLVDTICVASYDGRTQREGEPEILKGIDGDGSGWLVIDDLVDSGNTFRHLRKMLPRAFFAAVYGKPLGIESADLSAVPVAQATWLIFPWDAP